MVRTKTIAKTTICIKENGKSVKKIEFIACNNEKELQTALNKKYGRNGAWIDDVEWGERVHEMDDDFYYANSKIIKDTFAEASTEASTEA